MKFKTYNEEYLSENMILLLKNNAGKLGKKKQQKKRGKVINELEKIGWNTKQIEIDVSLKYQEYYLLNN